MFPTFIGIPYIQVKAMVDDVPYIISTFPPSVEVKGVCAWNIYADSPRIDSYQLCTCLQNIYPFVPKLETRNSKLETRNSKLETRNSKLETRNLTLQHRLYH